MATKASDTRSRELGAELRRRRELAGLNGLQLAQKAGWSQTAVCRLESGQGRISEVVVTTYLAHCGVPAPEVAKVLRLASLTEDGYLVRRGALRTLILHESTAVGIAGLATLRIPGLLQTEDYARAVMRLPGAFSEAELENAVARRIDRQKLLHRWRPPQLTFFLYEAALRCPIGGNRVMNEQLLHLSFLADRPHLTIQVVPFSVAARIPDIGHFWLMEYAEHEPVLYLENPFAAIFVENAEDIARTRRTLKQLAADALNEGQSREFLAGLASAYDRP